MNRIKLHFDGHCARLALSHPPVNVIDIAMMEELSAALAEIERRAEVSCVVISGEGRYFSAGVDIAAHTPEKIAEMLQKFHAVILAVARSQKVTIAKVHGNCLGGGAELAMVCDVAYTTDDAAWGFPEIKLACFPPVACAALASVVSQKRAAELILAGGSINGRVAAEMGLATSSGTQQDVEGRTAEMVERLGQLSAAALRVTKKAMMQWDTAHLDKNLAKAEKIYLEELMKTEDVREGVNAWAEKRKPKWKGI